MNRVLDSRGHFHGELEVPQYLTVTGRSEFIPTRYGQIVITPMVRVDAKGLEPS